MRYWNLRKRLLGREFGRDEWFTWTVSVLSPIVIDFAIFWIYALNVSIQPLQVSLWALVVEKCPTHQQAQASAWASPMAGGGNTFGYLVGFTPLPEIAKQFCLTRFQWLCIIASFTKRAPKRCPAHLSGVQDSSFELSGPCHSRFEESFTFRFLLGWRVSLPLLHDDVSSFWRQHFDYLG